MRVGHDTSNASPGWGLLPLSITVVLVLVNSAVSPAVNYSISTRPRSAASLPVSTASTGLLCLSVGAHVHHVRIETEAGAWPLPHALHSVRDIHLTIPMKCIINVSVIYTGE